MPSSTTSPPPNTAATRSSLRHDTRATAAVALALASLSGCEPQSSAVEAPLRVNGASCVAGTLSADFPNLIVGAPADRPLRVQDEVGGIVEVDVVIDDGSDPAFSILRAPFPSDDATVVPLRVQLTAPGAASGTLTITPVVGSPCAIALSASG